MVNNDIARFFAGFRQVTSRVHQSVFVSPLLVGANIMTGRQGAHFANTAGNATATVFERYQWGGNVSVAHRRNVGGNAFFQGVALNIDFGWLCLC